VSATAVGQLLIERHGVSAELVAQSGAAYRAWRRQGAEPSARLASELGRAVRALPAYRAG
jgi:hypothetical protein